MSESRESGRRPEESDRSAPLDRILEIAIEECLGAARAPDLTDRILASRGAPGPSAGEKVAGRMPSPSRAALRKRQVAGVGGADSLAGSAGRFRNSGRVEPEEQVLRRWKTIAAVLVFALALVASGVFDRTKQPAPESSGQASIALAVTEGELSYFSHEIARDREASELTRAYDHAGPTMVIPAESRILIELRLRDELRASILGFTVVEASSVGSLELQPGTQLRLMEIEAVDGPRASIAGQKAPRPNEGRSATSDEEVAKLVRFEVRRGSLTVRQDGRTSEFPAGSTFTAELDPLAVSSAKAPDRMSRMEMQRLIARQKQKIRQLEEAAELRVKLKDEDGGHKDKGLTKKSKGNPSIAFVDPNRPGVFEAVDWLKLGKSLREFAPELGKLGKSIQEGELDLEAGARIQQLNAEILRTIRVLVKGRVPGTGPLGRFTHPISVGNEVDQTLRVAGLALRPNQLRRLDLVVRHYMAEDENLRIEAVSEPFELATLLKESEMKERLYAEVHEILDAKQRAVLWSDETRNRLGGDLFGTGLLWQQFARPIYASTRASFARQVADRLAGAWELDEASSAKLDTLTKAWVRYFPSTYITQRADLLERNRHCNLLRKSRVLEAARQYLRLLREIDRTLSLEPRLETRVRKLQKLYVWIPI